MDNYTIPATRDEVIASLQSHAKLLMSTGWTLAAELASICRLNDEPGRPAAIVRSDNYLSATTIAGLGLRGLKSHNTVERHVSIWLDTHDGVYPEPGDTIVIPTTPYPPTTLHDGRYRDTPDRDAITEQAGIDGTGKAKAVDIAKNTKAMAAAIKASPRVAAAARAALEARGDAAEEAEAADPRPPRPAAPRYSDARYLGALAVVAEHTAAEQAGEYTPGPMARLGGTLLGQMLVGQTPAPADWDGALNDMLAGEGGQ